VFGRGGRTFKGADFFGGLFEPVLVGGGGIWVKF